MNPPLPDSWAAIAALLLGVLVIVLGLVLWSVRRHTDPVLRIGCDQPIDELVPSLAGLSLGTPVAGNAVELLENAAFFDAMLAAIGTAQRTVHFETFLWKDGALSGRLAAALEERARAGVAVRVLLDAIGSKQVRGPIAERLRAAGCRVEFFHKRSLRHLGMLNDRTHRKMLILDGREAFVGGHCIVDDWAGEIGRGGVADISLRLQGPIVHTVQAAFSENWMGHTGEMFAGDAVFPPLPAAGEVIIHAAFVKPEGSAPAVKVFHHAAICLARERIWIQNPYFIPEPDTIVAFGEAVARGVDVRVIMPTTGSSDNAMVQHAGHRNFERLLQVGVRLFEYPDALLHQKVMTIDGVWSAVGSSNFDDRSFETNDEITLGLLDPGLAGQLDAIFERYAADAIEVKLDQWRRRSLWHKLKDHAAYSINEFL
ncbi:phospholipase D-like domain-containing protein [Cognatilysobacter bugurensis]|uniref:Cardiolipin synthase B n=1 Tax=Cognatilysobacter bugurensis TaxID=543356 RepID=A0A918T0M0_9GAMM|nr:phospholipase D-like domain-containing protein [Lysobacter bugurensis]GHA83133.1 cardiolipin synthase B [Lysobacter bugurensis]